MVISFINIQLQAYHSWISIVLCFEFELFGTVNQRSEGYLLKGITHISNITVIMLFYYSTDLF